MHPQLQAIADEFASAQRRLHALVLTVPEDAWTRRADPARWSVSECVAHLNLTSAAFLPILRNGLDWARRLNAPPAPRYRRDPLGWVLWKTMGPPVRFRVKTAASFVPASDVPARVAVAEFDRLQAEQIRCVEEAHGLPIGRIRIASPFDPRAKYNLYAGLSILPRHQHRHLWQAERVWSTEVVGAS